MDMNAIEQIMSGMSEGLKPENRATVADVLDTRAKTHGDFTDNARVMQALKRAARLGENWHDGDPRINEHVDGLLSDVQKEALEMILHKIGRIVTGDPNVPDHWLDIEGYARLARERIAGE
jgi:hypothetical protein